MYHPLMADTGVGAIYDALKETGMYDNSVLVFSTDNGGAIENISNLPLRVCGTQGFTYIMGGNKHICRSPSLQEVYLSLSRSNTPQLPLRRFNLYFCSCFIFVIFSVYLLYIIFSFFFFLLHLPDMEHLASMKYRYMLIRKILYIPLCADIYKISMS